MRSRFAMIALCVFVGVLLLPPNALRGAWLPEASGGTEQWEKRLEALTPVEPMKYFELAEEVADAAASTDREQRELARHLFALAGALDPDHLGRSACLALADLEEEALAKRRLLALASLLGTNMGVSSGASVVGARDEASSSGQSTEISASAALAVSQAMSRYRKGQGSQALNELKKPGATELLQRFERMIPGGMQRFLEDCKLYHGQLKPTLSANEVVRQLRFESAILAAPHPAEQSWSGDLLLNNARPLIEVDPARLEESLGVDVTKPLYRRGRWVGK